MTLRNYRPLVVLATLALSSCPFNFKYNVENGVGEAVTSGPDAGRVAVVSPGGVAASSPRSDQSFR